MIEGFRSPMCEYGPRNARAERFAFRISQLHEHEQLLSAAFLCDTAVCCLFCCYHAFSSEGDSQPKSKSSSGFSDCDSALEAVQSGCTVYAGRLKVKPGQSLGAPAHSSWQARIGCALISHFAPNRDRHTIAQSSKLTVCALRLDVTFVL